MRNDKVMIITAHLDDIEVGMGGTVAKLSRSSDVVALTMCKGDHPGHEHVGASRVRTFRRNATLLGIGNYEILDYSDVKLDQELFLDNIVSVIYDKIQIHKPSVVYTQYGDDIHRDHRIVSEAVRIAARLREASPVNELYEFPIPGSTEWNFKGGVFNVFEDITETADKKMEAISRYTSELRSAPDPFSLDRLEVRDKYHGSLCGYHKAEIFKLIFKR